MSDCGCQTTPCNCTPDAACAVQPATMCDLYVPGTKNVWVEKGCSPGDENAPGVCMLNTLCDDSIIYIIQRDEKARQDLLKVTSDPHLIKLAKTVPRLPTVEEMDREQAQINQSKNSGSIPFYAVFRGQPPFSQ